MNSFISESLSRIALVEFERLDLTLGCSCGWRRACVHVCVCVCVCVCWEGRSKSLGKQSLLSLGSEIEKLMISTGRGGGGRTVWLEIDSVE